MKKFENFSHQMASFWDATEDFCSENQMKTPKRIYTSDDGLEQNDLIRFNLNGGDVNFNV